VLLDVLPNRKAVGDRAEIIIALANLGSPAALEPLASRYDGEDEDCRFYTLKAFDYIGGERAASLVREKGGKDEDNACRSLAARLAK
jgi:HEAT repeat protein